jgi:hypothetical protein
MKPETARDLLIPYLDGELDAQTAALLERHLAGDPALRRELEQLRALDADIAASEKLEPDAGMRARFDAFLSAEKQNLAEAGPSEPDEDECAQASPRLVFFPTWLLRGAAAAALLLVGIGVGWVVARREVPAPVRGATEVAAATTGDNRASAAEVESLRRDVALMRELLSRAPAAQQSASYRLQAVSYATGLNAPDATVVDALFTTLAQDPSANVRLAALEALSRFKSDPAVRVRLATALTQQTDPLVQIGLIGTLVEARAPEARDSFEQLLLRADVTSIVKGQAQQALTRL